MTKLPTAIMGPLAWDEALKAISYSFDVREQGIPGPDGDALTFDTGFGCREILGEIDAGDIALDTVSGQSVVLPSEHAGKFVLATFAAFDEEPPKKGEPDFLSLSGRHIPSNVVIGVGRWTASRLRLMRTADKPDGIHFISDSDRSINRLVNPRELLDYQAILSLFASVEQPKPAEANA